MMTSAFLSTLSLSAEKNCAQNSGAKRRDDIKSLIMTSPVLERQPVVVALQIERHDRMNVGGAIAGERGRRPAVSPRSLRSCWSPACLVRFANIRSRAQFGRKCRAYRIAL